MSTKEVSTPPPSDAPSADLGFDLPPPARPSRGKTLFFSGGVLLVLGGLFAVSFLPRKQAHAELEARAAQAAQALPRLVVAPPKLVSSERALRLPASIQPLEEAVIYARANGYVGRWLVDLGDKVKANQVLAVIETPELEQELSQARAALAKARAARLQAQAGSVLAQSRFDRTGKLVEAGVASRQELEQTEAETAVGASNVSVADAAIAAEEANIRRLSDLQRFSKVTAPFEGTITARTVDRGSLVTAGNGTPLFRLAATDTVRVYVQVPQDVAPDVTVGSPAKVTVREFGGRVFEGTVARTAGALDATTRTLNTEVRVPNPDGTLLSGMYAELALSLSSPRKVFEVPATALLSDAQGLRLVIVEPDNTLRLQPITIERDVGPTLQIATGLNGDERVVQIVNAELQAGQKVEPVAPQPAPAAPAPSVSAKP